MSTLQDKSDQNSRGSETFISRSLTDDEKERLRDDLDPLDKISPEMRRYVEDKDFLESYLRRENRFVEVEEGKRKPSRTGSFKQPMNSVPYTVKRGETLSGIALCNNMSLYQLKALNRLGSTMLFPGQVLYVPASQDCWEYVTHSDAKESAPSSCSRMSDDHSTLCETVTTVTATPAAECPEDVFRPAAEIEKRKSEPTDKTSAVANASHQEEEFCERYVNIKAKYITDGMGTVSGMLLVTPQCLMFNPSILDPLVIDNGIDSYSLILQMESVSSCAVYDDFIKMRQKDRPAGVQAPDGQKSNDQFLLCSRTIDLPHLSSTEHMIHSKAVNSLGTTQLSGDLKEDQEKHELYSINESPIDAGDTGPLIDGKKEDSCTELTESTQIDVTKNSHQIEVFEWNPDEFSEDSMNCRESSSNSADVRGQENGVAKKDEEKNSGKKKDASPVEFKRVSDAREVPVVSISPRKPAKKSEPVTIPRPSCHLGTVNRFFCVQLSGPLSDCSLTKSAVSVPTFFASQDKIGKQLLKSEGVKPEYWFAIALEKVDRLYAFLVQWCPCLQGMSYEQMKELEKDFVLISMSDVPESQRMSIYEGHYGSDPNRAVPGRHSSLGVEANPIPLLDGETAMLTGQRLLQLTESLPRRLIGYDWKLIYSTFCHGISLKTLYRNMLCVTGPVIVLVQDRQEEVFGALLSDPLRISEHSYGTGECFLFTFYPKYKRFGWTGNDPYFIKCNLDSFVVGGGDGHYGLWIDDNLYHGTTQRCTTFNNEDLTSNREFICQGLEAWGLY